MTCGSLWLEDQVVLSFPNFLFILCLMSSICLHYICFFTILITIKYFDFHQGPEDNIDLDDEVFPGEHHDVKIVKHS